MPAVLRPDEMQEFLAGGRHWDFRPFDGALVVVPCESPLKRKVPPKDDSQGELWDSGP
jgi:hypothetical protein